MKLTHSQKIFIQKNLSRLTVEETAKILNISVENVNDFVDITDNTKIDSKNTAAENDEGPAIGSRVSILTLSKSLLINNWLILIFLAILVLVLYVPFLNNGFVSDDIPGISQNRHIGDFKLFLQSPLKSFRPFLYFLSYKIGGISPWVFRTTNVLAHLFSTLALYVLLLILTKKNVAFIAASIFAVHPILTESVTWISGGSYSLYTFFFLLSFILYILFLTQKRILLYVLSLSTTLFALVTSVTAVVIPAIFFVYHMTYRRDLNKKNIKSLFLYLIPFFAAAIFMTYFHVSNINPRLTTFKNDYYQEVSTYDPLYQIPVAITSYINIILFPVGLTLYHTEPIFLAEYFIRLALFAGLIIYLIYAFFRQKKMFFWLSFYILSLAPTLTPYRISWIVAERYVYLGSIGIFFIIALVVNKIIESKKLETFGYMLFIVIILTFSTMTIFRNIDWLDEEHLWIATGKTSPSSWVNHNNLGDIYSRKGEYDKSIAEFNKSIEINPRYADAYNNLANVYIKVGKVDAALDTYKRALALNPRLWQSYQNIAVINYQLLNYKVAVEYTLKAIQNSPDNPPLYANLGIIYLKMGDKINAKKYFMKALQMDPKNQAATVGMKEAQ